MNSKITISPDDSEYEIFCKSMYNNHYYYYFKNNFIKFRQYSILKGFYFSMEYNTDMFSYNYLKDHHPDYLSEIPIDIIENNTSNCCIIL